jgi:hypothetical protein
MLMISIIKVEISPGGVASFNELGEDLKVYESANISSLLPHFSNENRFGIS